MGRYKLSEVNVMVEELQMKCPYCFEEIKDEAFVCRYCQRDLGFFRPILNRLSRIEETVSKLRTAANKGSDSEVGGTSGTSSVESTGTALKMLIALASSILFAVMFAWVAEIYPTDYSSFFDKPLDFLSVSSPFLAALWLGWSLPRLHRTIYPQLGVLPGFGGFVAWFLLHGHYQKSHLQWQQNLIVYVVTAPLWFLAGGVIGAQVRGPQERLRGGTEDDSTPGTSKGGDSHEIVLAMIQALTSILVAVLPFILGH